MKSILLGLLVVSLLVLSACGRVSKPTAPADSFYPHTYIVHSN